MASPKLDHNDYLLLKQCVEAATFQGSSVRIASVLLDKLDAHIATTQPQE